MTDPMIYTLVLGKVIYQAVMLLCFGLTGVCLVLGALVLLAALFSKRKSRKMRWIG